MNLPVYPPLWACDPVSSTGFHRVSPVFTGFLLVRIRPLLPRGCVQPAAGSHSRNGLGGSVTCIFVHFFALFANWWGRIGPPGFAGLRRTSPAFGWCRFPGCLGVVAFSRLRFRKSAIFFAFLASRPPRPLTMFRTRAWSARCKRRALGEPRCAPCAHTQRAGLGWAGHTHQST